MNEALPDAVRKPLRALNDMLIEGDWVRARQLAEHIAELCAKWRKAEVQAQGSVKHDQCSKCNRFVDDSGTPLQPQPLTLGVREFVVCNECADKESGRTVLPAADRE
jgi:hypothetical protein